MRIAFQTYGTGRWQAGWVAFQDLWVALRQLDAQCPELVLVKWGDKPVEEDQSLDGLVDGTIWAKYPQSTSDAPAFRHWWQRIPVLRNQARRASSRVGSREDAVLARNQIDCSFSVMFERRRDVSVPLLTWIFDLQYRHMPELFDPPERAKREAMIRREAALATLLVVTSDTVYSDLTGLLPQFSYKVRKLPWVSNIPDWVYERDPGQVVQVYHLPDKFLYLPNQFWMHKNHHVVIEALARLRGKGVKPSVVCSGSLIDHRKPEHIGDLLQKIARQDLYRQVFILGQVPREDVFLLMRQAACLLTPTLFEGFGLSVAEAASLGKRMLISDLPTLREQNAPCALYFNPNDPDELADKMQMIWETTAPGPDLSLEAQARAALPARQKAFAMAFLDLAQESVRLGVPRPEVSAVRDYV